VKRRKERNKKKIFTLRGLLFARVESVPFHLFSFLNATLEMQHLVLDRDVRDWVLVPLTLCIALMMLMRQYATVSVR